MGLSSKLYFYLAAAMASTLAVNSAQIASFQAGSGAWQMGTLVVGNIDNDAELEIVVPYRNTTTGTWQVDAFNINGQRYRAFPTTHYLIRPM